MLAQKRRSRAIQPTRPLAPGRQGASDHGIHDPTGANDPLSRSPRSGGAPKGNQNARKHGFHSRQRAGELEPAHSALTRHRAPDLGELLSKSGGDDLTAEIRTLRVLIDRALDDGASLEEIAVGFQLLIRAVSANHRMSKRARADLTDALAEVIERLGGQMGLDPTR